MTGSISTDTGALTLNVGPCGASTLTLTAALTLRSTLNGGTAAAILTGRAARNSGNTGRTVTGAAALGAPP